MNFASDLDRSRHLSLFEPTEDDDVKIIDPANKIKCDLCGKAFKSERDCKQHRNKCRVDKPPNEVISKT